MVHGGREQSTGVTYTLQRHRRDCLLLDWLLDNIFTLNVSGLIQGWASIPMIKPISVSLKIQSSLHIALYLILTFIFKYLLLYVREYRQVWILMFLSRVLCPWIHVLNSVGLPRVSNFPPKFQDKRMLPNYYHLENSYIFKKIIAKFINPVGGILDVRTLGCQQWSKM